MFKDTKQHWAKRATMPTIRCCEMSLRVQSAVGSTVGHTCVRCQNTVYVPPKLAVNTTIFTKLIASTKFEHSCLIVKAQMRQKQTIAFGELQNAFVNTTSSEKICDLKREVRFAKKWIAG